MKIKIIAVLLLCLPMAMACNAGQKEKSVTLTKEQLLDKIKGGWAGKTIGCTFGSPVEFRYNGRMVPDTTVIPWPDHYIKWEYDNESGLYDDLYMDLTFVDVLERCGLDAPVDSLAKAFAYAGYKLWHANQAARYNIMHGINPPESGYWKNNPHADDIDFQIESDFAGLMSPGMPVAAAEVCDRVGHIMNYGDGWYGGVYVATMYTLAFLYNDIDKVVNEALRAIPDSSDYHKCISDAIRWSKENPDWRVTWQKIEDKYADEISCPKGTKDPFDIQAKVNSAYVVMGLLYGKGDFGRTIDIAARCGADADCNPSTAAGILGTMLGYSKIPEKWMVNLREVEDRNFDYTDISLNRAYVLGLDHALQMVKRNGGKVDGDKVMIALQTPTPVRLEQSFEGLALVSKDTVRYNNFRKPWVRDFEGSGIVLMGRVRGKAHSEEDNSDYVAKLAVDIDGKRETIDMPESFTRRRFDIYWNYELPQGKHKITVSWLNPIPDTNVILEGTLIYKNKE